MSNINFVPDYTVLDIETTGINPHKDKIIEISAIRYRNNEETVQFSTLVNPEIAIPEEITTLTGIKNEDVSNAPKIDCVIPQLIEFLSSDIILGHNIHFDVNFINSASIERKLNSIENDTIDTLQISRKLLPSLKNHQLGTVAEYFNIPSENAHRALNDCRTTANIYFCLSKCEPNQFKETIFDINSLQTEENPIKGKKIYCLGTLTLLSEEDMKLLCEKCDAVWMEEFLKTTDFLVMAKNTYAKFLRAEYSVKMKKALALKEERGLTIISENDFLALFGIATEQPSCYTKKKKRLNVQEIISLSDDYDTDSPFYQKLCIITGTLSKMTRESALQEIVNRGGLIGNSVTKKTDYLIVARDGLCSSIEGNKSTKQKKAEELNAKGCKIKILSEDDFYKLLYIK